MKYDKDKFAYLLEKAKGARSLNQFALLSNVDSGYLSRLLRKKKDNPPTPEVLGKIASKAHNNISYEDLMAAAGYISEELNAVYFPENLRLIRDSMSTEEFVDNIIRITGNPAFTVDLIESLEKGKIEPTDVTINVLSRFANVSNTFWFKKNTKETLENERLNFILNKQNGNVTRNELVYSIPEEYSPEIKQFIADERNLEYIELAKLLSDRKINCSIVKSTIFKDEKNKKNPK